MRSFRLFLRSKLCTIYQKPPINSNLLLEVRIDRTQRQPLLATQKNK